MYDGSVVSTSKNTAPTKIDYTRGKQVDKGTTRPQTKTRNRETTELTGELRVRYNNTVTRCLLP